MNWVLVFVALFSTLSADVEHQPEKRSLDNVPLEGDIDAYISQVNPKQLTQDKTTEQKFIASENNKTKEIPKNSQPPPVIAKNVATTSPPEATTDHSPFRSMINISDIYFVAIVAGCSAAGLIGLIVAVICWFRLQRKVKAASDIDYPAYGVTGPNTDRGSINSGDRKLAQSAQMYHYQHQKQQMIAMEKVNSDMKHDASEDDTDDENDEGDYTVYECPGLAPTGEMEVKNPLFSEPARTPPVTSPDTDKHNKEP